MVTLSHIFWKSVILIYVTVAVLYIVTLAAFTTVSESVWCLFILSVCSVQQQMRRVSLCMQCRARANAPAARCWLRRSKRRRAAAAKTNNNNKFRRLLHV